MEIVVIGLVAICCTVAWVAGRIMHKHLKTLEDVIRQYDVGA